MVYKIVNYFYILLFSVPMLFTSSLVATAEPAPLPPGLGGFSIRPLLNPVTVRYTSAKNITGQSSVLVQSRVNDETAAEYTAFDFELDIEAQDDQRIWTTRLTKTDFNGLVIESDHPILQGIRRTDALGVVRSVEITLPYMELAQGKNLSAKDRERLERETRRSTTFPVFNEKPVAFGDEVFRRSAQDFFGDALPDFTWEGGAKGIAAGLTDVAGREHLVVIHWGKFVGRHADTEISGGASGYSLVDLVTGLRTVSMVTGLLDSSLRGHETSILITNSLRIRIP
jgi:hypothetical protein